MILESLKHGESSFATLTYDEANLPSDGSLVPKHTTDWLKRLRDKLPSGSLRYFLVGEYVDQTQRPHYHAALFGIGPSYSGLIQDTWGFGHTMLGDLTPASSRYVAGYVTKKMTSKDDIRLNGRHPEFARMSRMPGIGAPAVPALTVMLNTPLGLNNIDQTGDIPAVLQHGRSQLPLGRYLRSQLRKELGFQDGDSFKESAWKEELSKKNAFQQSEEMLAVWLTYSTSSRASQITFTDYLKEINDTKILSAETRMKLKQRKSL